MLKTFTLICICIFCFKYSFATVLLPKKLTDTSINPTNKISLTKEYFLDKYGSDDSSRALIKFYFSKRSKSKKLILIPSSISTALAALFAVAAISENNGNSQSTPTVHKIDTPGTTGPLIFFLCTALLFTIIGSRILNKYSPKMLLISLENYRRGKHIRRWISASASFKKFLY